MVFRKIRRYAHWSHDPACRVFLDYSFTDDEPFVRPKRWEGKRLSPEAVEEIQVDLIRTNKSHRQIARRHGTSHTVVNQIARQLEADGLVLPTNEED